MKLAELYERDIERSVDPVAKVDHRSSETIKQEIEEYFFTDPLFEHIKTFLEKLTGGTEETTGFWINGFYGSGKSHFLKYLFYILSEEFSDDAFDHLIESLVDYDGDPLEQPLRTPEAKRFRKELDQLTIEPIMFNISAYAKKDDDDRQTVTETFFNRFNNFRGYHKSDIRIARFEKQLDEQGKLDAFRKVFEEQTGEVWGEKALTAVDWHLKDVIEAARAVADLDLESTRETLQREVRVSTDDFVDQVNDYLEDQPDDFRLVFLVDEVSQFMAGNTNMLLDLQTIVEELGTRCENKVWVACTAQQELKELLDSTNVNDVREAFGRIIARFKPLPLEAQEADRIAKKRILEKNDTAERRLGNFFVENDVALRNQFARDNDVYRGIESKEDFIECYPFIPYQFTLITDIIQSFVQENFLVPGVSGTERSLIGITHETARECKDEEVGYVVPLDAFYNNQIKDNLKNFARNIISKALNLEKVQDRPFWQRVVKALFLLAHLVESKKINFRSTTENLAFVLMNEVDQAKKELQQKTQEALDYLVSQNLVSETDGEYRFLLEEEVRVKNRIDNFRIPSGEQVDFLIKNIVSPLTNWSRRTSLDGSKIQLLRRVDGRDLGASGSVPVEFLITEGRDPNAFAFDRAKKDLVFCLHEEFGPEQQAKLRDVVRVNAFRKANYDQAQGKRREAIEMFSKQSEQKVQHLRDWFTRALKSCSYVSAQQVKDASNHNGGTAQDRYESILDEHLRQVFKKRELALGYASSRAELREAAADTQTDIDNSLAPAEQEVHGFLRRATGPNVADTVNHFSGTDYAWQDTETLHLLLNLERKNKWRFRWNSEDISRKSFAEKAVNRSERASITLHEQESIDPQVLYQVTQAVNQTIFNEPLIDQETDPRQLDGQIVQALREKRDHYDSLWRQHRGMPFASHLAKARDEVDDILDVSRMQDRFEELIERADRLQAAVDTAIQLESFVDANGETYKAIRDFVSRKQDEFDLLEPEDRETAEKLRSAVRTEERPDEDFPRIKQYYESVRGALQEQVDALRAEALDAYREAFDELEAYRDEQNVDDVLPSREEVLGPIRRTDDPNRLEAEKARVSEFQTQYRVKVRNAAEQAKAEQQPAGGDREDSSPATPKTTEPFSVSEALGQRDLESEDDVDDFLQDLRRELVRRVNDDKIIVIS